MISRLDIVDTNSCSDEEAIERGCIFRAWINDMDMGGWTGHEENEFESAIENELEYALGAEECALSMQQLLIYDLTGI